MSSVIIDINGTIYIGNDDFFAINPDGTLKWRYNIGDFIHSTPVVDENGIIYFGTVYGSPGLYAIRSNGTLKWKYDTGNIFSSPVVGNEGTIFFCDSDNHYIKALSPNGTLKWRFKTDYVLHSSPAIGLDGTIYCGSHDDYVYALYPNNGTLKWKFKTGNWVHGSPTIGSDGTVYIGSDDEYLYALNPENGSMIWKSKVGAMFASPALSDDGILYFGVWSSKFRAVYSNNGTKKWSFDLGEQNGVWGSSAAISADGTIFFGTYLDDGSGGGDIIALNPDGSEKWRTRIANDYVWSSPAIAEDGTIYIGSANEQCGYLHAIGGQDLEADGDGPYYGLTNEPVQFNGNSIGGFKPYTWHWDFGDGNTSDEQNPTHIYTTPNNYTVTLTVTDNSSNQSSDNTWAWIQESNDPPNKPTIEGELRGKIKTDYDYQFMSSDPEGLRICYFIDWRDGSDTGWMGPYKSGEEITLNHQWFEKGDFVIRCKAKDPYGDESEWGELRVTMPKSHNQFLNWIYRFTFLQKLLFGLIR